jgi:hypothetical protein
VSDVSQIVQAINKLASPRFIDFVTLSIAFVSLLIASAAMKYTKNQKNIQSRSEQYELYVDVLNILYFLKHYTGEVTEESNAVFKKLLRLKIIIKSAFSDDAATLITDIISKMDELQLKKHAYEAEVTPQAAALLEAVGIDPNIHDAMGIQYMEIRQYFKKDSFSNFEKLFVLTDT